MKTSKTLKVDTFLIRNIEFWQDLEVLCVAECCGIDAFDFDKETIQSTVFYYNELDIIYNLEALFEEIDNSKFKKVSSNIFNINESKKTFKNRIKEILKAL